MSCGVGPTWLWQWLWLAAAAPIRPLAWELPYPAPTALKIRKKERVGGRKEERKKKFEK